MIEIFETADGTVFEGRHIADGINDHDEDILIETVEGERYWLNGNLGIDRYPADEI